MADLVVGLAKTVVQGAMAKAQSAINEEAMLRQSAQRDIVFFTGEFEMMHTFLTVPTTEGVENKVMMTWVRQVRELAYDVEDCIEFVIHLDTKTSWWWRMLPSCMLGAAIPLDEAVHEIEQLKARVQDVSMRNTRYRIFSDSGSKPVITTHQLATPGGAALSATAFSMLIEAREGARRRQGLGDLTQLITNKDITDDPALQVISLWGTGGDLGMISIIRKAYNDPEICRTFPCRSWVKLMHPFDPHEFVRRFMAQVYANACEQQGDSIGVHVLTKMEASQHDLLKEFVEEVNSKSYFIVLENLTDMVDWDAVRTFLPDKKNGSWIIVSTQQLEIANLCIGHSCQPLELKQFTPEHSVCAFFKEGSQDYGNKGKPMACEESLNLSMEVFPYSNRKAVSEWMINYPLVGREPQINELRRYTAGARFSGSPVISVWCIAGIGKSALVRNLYYDRMLHSNQFNKYRWVDVSQPFSLRDFSRSLLSDFRSQKDPIKECRELLKQHQCLIVIDNLKSKEEWDLIQAALISRRSLSVIIVITTEASIATYCTTDENQVINVKGLNADAAMDLFRNEVMRKNPLCSLYNHKGAELKELILKCGGLPIVIVSTAALLATQLVTSMDAIRSLNIRFMHHLENNLEYDSLRGLFGWMNTSYFRDCPDSLKPCIFYLSIFPLECNIRRRRLVRRWIAEGYSRDSDRKSAEEQGDEFFSKLLELGMIQQIPQLVNTATNGTKMVQCQVNGFVCEYIVSRRMEENLVCELGPNCVLTTQRTGRHLIILRDWDRDKIMFESIDFSRLRSMTVYGQWKSFFISKNMRLLRVLDLEDAFGVNDEDLEKMVKQLRRLKFLSLRGCSGICRLPNSLGDLRQLQTLDVRDTSIVTLPASIIKLQKLQYIRAGSKVPSSSLAASFIRVPEFFRSRGLVGAKVPRAIGKLTALHTLGVVNVDASGGRAIVEEIKKLTQLRKLGVSGIKRHNINELNELTHLESLFVQFDQDSQGCLEHISLPWENIQSLTLYGLQDMLPVRNSLSKLSKLDLEMDTLQSNGMEFLGNLPELCILHLRVKQLEDGKLHFHAELNGLEVNTFKKVKILEVTCRSRTLNVIFGSSSMKKLELLKIDYSSALYTLSGLDNLSEFKEVLIKGTVDKEIKTQLENQLAFHPKTPTVKLAELTRSS